MKTTFKTKSNFLMSDSALDCVDPYFEDCMVRNIANWFNPIAYMKPEVMRKNFILLSGTSGWNITDRSIPLPIANYLLEHLSMIYMGLISNDTFRQAIKEAVEVEIILDEKSEDFVKNIRKDMTCPDGHCSEEMGIYTVDSGQYDEDKFSWFLERIVDSFQKIILYDEVENEFISELRHSELTDNGYIISNFAYLFRALSKNELIFHYVKKVIDSVERQLNIN